MFNLGGDISIAERDLPLSRTAVISSEVLATPVNVLRLAEDLNLKKVHFWPSKVDFHNLQVGSKNRLDKLLSRSGDHCASGNRLAQKCSLYLGYPAIASWS